MENILKALPDHFYCQPELMTQEAKIKANHQLLRQRLSKRNRKMVLRIILILFVFAILCLKLTILHK
ncbi:hypothetical protein Psch_00212 [Pelotomaculum schinkii]|uniref:Uncharacterized protein n=1 Tax=Pelotomaculum schinkii TaxID=78350 RepID=A0A4Y7RD78_9FIRM|nr:hypothetical protein Psch_00212 [Pelotomaculum schinkii]